LFSLILKYGTGVRFSAKTMSIIVLSNFKSILNVFVFKFQLNKSSLSAFLVIHINNYTLEFVEQLEYR
jgi:hypothetical protein